MTDETAPTPTFFASEPILALRTWLVHNNRLSGWVFFAQHWPVAAPTVGACIVQPFRDVTPHYVCRRFGVAPAPHDGGRCGIHGVAIEKIVHIHIMRSAHAVTFFRMDTDYVVHNDYVSWVTGGIVALWGRVLLGENGIYRAERAYPVALFAAGHSETTARAYGISVVPMPTSLDALRATFENARGLLKEVTPHEPR